MDNRDDRVYPWRLNAPSQGYGKPKKQVGLEEKKNILHLWLQQLRFSNLTLTRVFKGKENDTAL